jgi:hypothetical protein
MLRIRAKGGFFVKGLVTFGTGLPDCPWTGDGGGQLCCTYPAAKCPHVKEFAWFHEPAEYR